jgi:hypothetical protein
LMAVAALMILRASNSSIGRLNESKASRGVGSCHRELGREKVSRNA